MVGLIVVVVFLTLLALWWQVWDEKIVPKYREKKRLPSLEDQEREADRLLLETDPELAAELGIEAPRPQPRGFQEELLKGLQQAEQRTGVHPIFPGQLFGVGLNQLGGNWQQASQLQMNQIRPYEEQLRAMQQIVHGISCSCSDCRLSRRGPSKPS